MSDPAPPAVATGTVAVVYNPVKGDVARVRAAIAKKATSAGFGEPLWYATTREDIGADAARQAVAAGASLVIASGGDGTVRAVAGALRHTSAALGIIPSGTGNLLARNLGIPIGNIPAAVAIAFDAPSRRVDVGLVELTDARGGSTEHPFMVVAGIGIDAAMIANTNPLLKERIGWLAYVDGALRSAVSLKPAHMRMRVAEPDSTAITEHTFEMRSVLVGNVGALPGNIALLPDARIDDGVLDVAVMHPKTLFGWLYVGRTIVWENHVLRRSPFGRKLIKLRAKRSPNVLSYTRGAAVAVKLDEPQPAEIDGDEFGLVVKAVFSVDAASLLVRSAE